jgi:hypothetical protein
MRLAPELLVTGHVKTVYNFLQLLKTNYVLTYLRTPWSRVLLEKLTGMQLVNKFPAFYRHRKFITAFTSAL